MKNYIGVLYIILKHCHVTRFITIYISQRIFYNLIFTLTYKYAKNSLSSRHLAFEQIFANISYLILMFSILYMVKLYHTFNSAPINEIKCSIKSSVDNSRYVWNKDF